MSLLSERQQVIELVGQAITAGARQERARSIFGRRQQICPQQTLTGNQPLLKMTWLAAYQREEECRDEKKRPVVRLGVSGLIA